MKKTKGFLKQDRPEVYAQNCCGCPSQKDGGCLTCDIASEDDKKQAKKIIDDKNLEEE